MKAIINRNFLKKESAGAITKNAPIMQDVNKCLKELAELERLAEIGRATEKAFKVNGFVIIQTEEIDEYQEIKNIERLIDWEKEDN